MNINGKQVGTVFISFIFILSGISFAISWDPPTESGEDNTNVLKQPVAHEQRLIFVENDVTVLTFFYLEDNSDSIEVRNEVERLNNEFGEKLLLEEIDISVYQTFSAEYNIKSVPVILIRGKENINAPIRLEGIQDYAIIKENICSTYKEQPELCD